MGKGCKLYLESGRAREGDWGNFCDISEIEPSNPGPLIGSDWDIGFPPPPLAEKENKNNNLDHGLHFRIQQVGQFVLVTQKLG